MSDTPTARAGEMAERYEQRLRNQLAIINLGQRKLLAVERIAQEMMKGDDGEPHYGQLLHDIIMNKVQVDDKGEIIDG